MDEDVACLIGKSIRYGFNVDHAIFTRDAIFELEMPEVKHMINDGPKIAEAIQMRRPNDSTCHISGTYIA